MTLATVAASLTLVAPKVAVAAERGKAAVTSGMTDISARISARRRLTPGGAAAAVFAGVVGVGLAIAAAQNRAAYAAYYDDYGGGGPVYVAPGSGYGYYGGYYGGGDPGYGPLPHGYGTEVAYVNGHPSAGW